MVFCKNSMTPERRYQRESCTKTVMERDGLVKYDQLRGLVGGLMDEFDARYFRLLKQQAEGNEGGFPVFAALTAHYPQNEQKKPLRFHGAPIVAVQHTQQVIEDPSHTAKEGVSAVSVVTGSGRDRCTRRIEIPTVAYGGAGSSRIRYEEFDDETHRVYDCSFNAADNNRYSSCTVRASLPIYEAAFGTVDAQKLLEQIQRTVTLLHTNKTHILSQSTLQVQDTPYIP